MAVIEPRSRAKGEPALLTAGTDQLIGPVSPTFSDISLPVGIRMEIRKLTEKSDGLQDIG
jgi:hypothetical protein